MRIIDFTMGLILILSVIYVSNTMGYARGYDAHIEPQEDYVYFSDYKSSYKLHKDSTYRTEMIEDGFNVTYFIYIWHEDNYTVVEYQDTLIDGEFTFAKHWMQSFIMNFGGIE